MSKVFDVVEKSQSSPFIVVQVNPNLEPDRNWPEDSHETNPGEQPSSRNRF